MVLYCTYRCEGDQLLLLLIAKRLLELLYHISLKVCECLLAFLLLAGVLLEKAFILHRGRLVLMSSDEFWMIIIGIIRNFYDVFMVYYFFSVVPKVLRCSYPIFGIDS